MRPVAGRRRAVKHSRARRSAVPCINVCLTYAAQASDDLLVARAVFAREVLQQLLRLLTILSSPRRDEWSFLCVCRGARSAR